MSDQIGAMRTRVRLERPVRTPDALGGAALSWSDQGDVWAAIDAGGVNRGPAFDTAPSIGAYRLTINRREDVRAGWRVIWGARVLGVIGVRDEGGARFVLVCQEETL